jgi:hypothetical protein
MKKAIIVITTAVMFVSCRSKEEKTAAASATQPQTVVVEKVKYVPVQTNTATPANSKNNKQGWSKAAKGTAIGAGGGALVGATVTNNKAAGAVIGGAIGAGTGYLIGRGEDKKDGRVQPKKKNQ